jgi:hypothetical protein
MGRTTRKWAKPGLGPSGVKLLFILRWAMELIG